MKRDREVTEVEARAMANCLMLLSRVGEAGCATGYASSPARRRSAGGDRMFTCKTCNREFSSFQALGGHRASHKKPRLMAGDLGFHLGAAAAAEPSPVKPKTHECSICGLEFPIGQALGGHMRRHRGLAAAAAASAVTESSASSGIDDDAPKPNQVPVLKKSTSKRVVCLDLNLSPLENDYLSLQFEKVKTVAPPPPPHAPLMLDLVL